MHQTLPAVKILQISTDRLNSPAWCDGAGEENSVLERHVLVVDPANDWPELHRNCGIYMLVLYSILHCILFSWAENRLNNIFDRKQIQKLSDEQKAVVVPSMRSTGCWRTPSLSCSSLAQTASLKFYEYYYVWC
jgi:hypothetical protein